VISSKQCAICVLEEDVVAVTAARRHMVDAPFPSVIEGEAHAVEVTGQGRNARSL